MPPDPQQQPNPAPPPPPPGGPPAGPGLEGRVDGLEAEQKRQGGMLEQILARLPGSHPGGQTGQSGQAAPAAPNGKSVAELVREGIDHLEAEKATKAEADANRTAREEHAARIKALEERAPKETAATPLGGLRARAQRVVFGIDEPHR